MIIIYPFYFQVCKVMTDKFIQHSLKFVSSICRFLKCKVFQWFKNSVRDTAPIKKFKLSISIYKIPFSNDSFFPNHQTSKAPFAYANLQNSNPYHNLFVISTFFHFLKFQAITPFSTPSWPSPSSSPSLTHHAAELSWIRLAVFCGACSWHNSSTLGTYQLASRQHPSLPIRMTLSPG